MEYYKTEIKNLFLLKFKKKKDKRGFFAEIYNSNKNKKKINLNFLQQNISFSKYKNVFRGMHFQTRNFSQDNSSWKKFYIGNYHSQSPSHTLDSHFF